MLKQLFFIVITTFVTSIANAFELTESMSASEKGKAIAAESIRRDDGWGDSSANMQMVLIDRKGRRSERQIRLRNLEVENDGDKSLTIFDEPRDVKGTAFLSFTHSLVPDEQWLYLPALGKVKRISSANKSGPFMGSEFAFEDLSSFELDKYGYEFLKEEAVNGIDCYVSKLFPQYKHSGYTHQIVWLDKTNFRPQKIEYYDRKGALLKTQIAEDYKVYLDKFWRPSKSIMVNHQSGKSTELYWSNYAFGKGLTEKDFNKRRLQNVQ